MAELWGMFSPGRGRDPDLLLRCCSLLAPNVAHLSRRGVCVLGSRQSSRPGLIRDGGAGFSRGEATVCAPAGPVRVRVGRFASRTFKRVSIGRFDVIEQCSDVPCEVHDALSWSPVRDVSSLEIGMGGHAGGCARLAGVPATSQHSPAHGETRARADGNVASVHSPSRATDDPCAQSEHPGLPCAYTLPQIPSTQPVNRATTACVAYWGYRRVSCACTGRVFDFAPVERRGADICAIECLVRDGL